MTTNKKDNPECKNCGLLKSTCENAYVRCRGNAIDGYMEHDFSHQDIQEKPKGELKLVKDPDEIWFESKIAEAKKEQIEVVRKWAERTIIDTGISNGYYNALTDLLTFLEGLK